MTWVMFKCLLQLLDRKQHIKKRRWGMKTSQGGVVRRTEGKELQARTKEPGVEIETMSQS